MAAQINWAALIFGGIFLGAWIYGLTFGFEQHGWEEFSWGQWLFWGIIGIAIAGGLYAARVTSDWVQIIIIIGAGIAIGMLLLAALLEEEAHIVASVVAGAGALLVVAGIPRQVAAAAE
jgi:hypothetical protein